MKKSVGDLGEKRKGKIRNNLEPFAIKYPRIKRENININSDYILEDERPFFPNYNQFNDLEKEELIYAVTKEEPCEGLFLITHGNDEKDIDLDEICLTFNALLIYRMFKLMYGTPNIIGCFIDINQQKPHLAGFYDWSYFIRVSNSLFAEIRSKYGNHRFLLRYWTDVMPSKKPDVRQKISNSMAQFLKSFFHCIENSLSLFDEREELNKQTNKITTQQFQNDFAGKYHSAEKMLKLAENLDIRPERSLKKWGEDISTDILSTGSVYFTSAILFIASLESLIGILYEVLLKDDFLSGLYKRMILRDDLEARLLTMHLFCNGFNEQIIKPKTESELLNRFRQLKEFRNNTIHGNITDEHFIYAFIEDKITFYYSPIRDFRGTITTKGKNKALPTNTVQMDKKAVLYIKEIVDEIKDNILSAMERDTREQVEKWLFDALVPAKRNVPLSKILK